MKLLHQLAAASAGIVLSVGTVAAFAQPLFRNLPLGPGAAQAAPCPPGIGGGGLCIPVQQAPRTATPVQAFAVGDLVPPAELHIVSRPGAYGLSNPPTGNSYAIVEGRLVRVDGHGKILSILRQVDAIVD